MIYVRQANRLELDRGCTNPITLTVTDTAGNPFVWNGERLMLELRRNPEDKAALLTWEAETDDDGFAYVVIPPESTTALEPGTYWYRVIMYDSDGVWPVIQTAQVDLLP